jgi:hypothetical protein
VEAWQGSSTPAESAGKVGLPVGVVVRWAHLYRKHGVWLKAMPYVSQATVTAARLLMLGRRLPR